MSKKAQDDSKRSDRDDGCWKVLSDYFDLTGDTMERQVGLCREISKKMAAGEYSAGDAQKDWQECVDAAAEYGREATRLWLEGVTRCGFAPGLSMWPGAGDLFGDRSADEGR